MNTDLTNPIHTFLMEYQMNTATNFDSKTNQFKYLGDKCALGSQELRGQLHRVNDQSVLRRSLRRPGSTDVGGAIMKHQIKGRAAVLLHQPPQLGDALSPRDVLLDREGAANRSDGDQVDADDEAADGDALDGDLHPTAGGVAEIEDGVGGVEEGVLGVELEELP